MPCVVKVGRIRTRSATVLLSNGKSVRLPKEMALWGKSFDESDFVSVSLTCGWYLWHKSMLEKPPKVAANKKLFRDYSDFNAENELAAIKKCILSCHRHIFGRFWASDQLDDFALEVFLRLWDRDFYRGFDSNRGRYEAYLQESVHNVIIDIIRLKNVRDSRNTLSLNAPLSVDSDSGGELLDMVVDTTNQDVTEVICANELQNRMRARVVELDSAGSALPGFSYGVIFDALVTGTLEDLTKHYPYGKRVLATYVSKLRSELACVCQEYA